jgi:hypothetical protein
VQLCQRMISLDVSGRFSLSGHERPWTQFSKLNGKFW